jgi:hypothetical protein
VHGYTVVRPQEQGGEHALVDSEGHARRGYDMDGDALVLVRPDGYIGLFARPGTIDELDDYLGLLTPTSRAARFLG